VIIIQKNIYLYYRNYSFYDKNEGKSRQKRQNETDQRHQELDLPSRGTIEKARKS
jgi:hypothetical protein